jgi:hypothetical protein
MLSITAQSWGFIEDGKDDDGDEGIDDYDVLKVCGFSEGESDNIQVDSQLM